MELAVQVLAFGIGCLIGGGLGLFVGLRIIEWRLARRPYEPRGLPELTEYLDGSHDAIQ